MPSLDETYPEVRDALARRYGNAPSWPREEEPFAALVAAWLGRTLDPGKLGASLEGLRNASLHRPDALAEADPSEIAEALSASGAKLAPKALAPLKKLARWAADRNAESFPKAATAALREELIALNGIGPGTADVLLLMGLDRPVFPVDRPSYRVFARHGWIEPTADYEEARDAFERREADHPAGLRDLGYQLGRVAAEFCKATRAKCERCPLRAFLPEGGPIDPGGQ